MGAQLRRLRNGLVAVTTFLILTTGGITAAAKQTTADAPPAAPLDGPVDEQLTWLLDVFNGGAQTLATADVTARFAPEFLGEMPADEVVATVQGWATFGPFVLDGFTRPPTPTQANAFGRAGGTPFVMPIAIEAEPPHRITGMNLSPVPPPPGVELAPVVDVGGKVLAEPGRIDGLFDVGGGRRLYLSCVGTGGPTVVLEAADGDLAATWFAVERAVDPFTRVCTYDRANTVGSASDPAPTPRSGADVVADLHALFATAGVPAPYVLVGHSDGGLYARLYAHTYPDEVAGLVLIETAHEDLLARIESLVGPELWAPFQALIAQGPNLEGMDFEATTAEVRAARVAAPLRPMPLVVVIAGQATDPLQFPPGWPVEAHQQLERELQDDLAGLVPGGQLVVAERSGHYVHQTEPELVVDAIRHVVEAVRDPNVSSEAPPRLQ